MANNPSKASRIISLDYGLARIGLAMSDESKMIASPIGIITTERKLEKTASKIAKELKRLEDERHFTIEEIILGMPLQMNGKMGMLGDEIIHFIDFLKKLVTCPIKLWDERLTTVQAERSMKEGSMSRKKRSKVVDTITATIILQNYLDSLPNSR